MKMLPIFIRIDGNATIAMNAIFFRVCNIKYLNYQDYTNFEYSFLKLESSLFFNGSLSLICYRFLTYRRKRFTLPS